MGKYVIECETDDYGLNEETKYFADLFETRTNFEKQNLYNDCQIVFRVYHISSTSGVSEYKDFILTCSYDNGNIINLIDLKPENQSFIIGYNNDDSGYVKVSGKGSIIGAKLKLQVLYCTILGMFNFLNCSKFDKNITVNFPKNFIKKEKIHLINGWKENIYFENNYILKDGIVHVNLCANSGMIAENIVIADNLPNPKIEQQMVCIDSDGVCGCIELLKSGHLRVKKLLSSKDTMCSFSYLVDYI